MRSARPQHFYCMYGKTSKKHLILFSYHNEPYPLITFLLKISIGLDLITKFRLLSPGKITVVVVWALKMNYISGESKQP